MYTYAKNITRFTLACFTAATLIATQQPTLESDTSGKQRVLALMNHAEANVQLGDADTQAYARTQSLSQDLGLANIVDFFGCKTEVGLWYLEKTLSEPRKSNDMLVQQRQAWIRRLVENPELKKEVDALLQAAHEQEQEAIVLFSDFFKGKTCPELKQLEVVKQQNPWMYPLIKNLTYNSIGRSVGFGLSFVSHAALTYSLYSFARNYYNAVKEYGFSRVYTKTPAIVYFEPGMWALLEAVGIYGSYKDCSTAAEKRAKIHALNQLLKISEKLEALAQKAEAIQQNQFSAQIQSDTSGVINAINASRYAHKTSYLFAVPLVHTFLYKLYENEHQVAPLFASIAEMDAYNAIATRMLESQAQNNKFCFATYIDSAKPKIETTGFWNVLVKNPVVNAISETHSVILTGPNAGGKTTSIRALLQNIVLAQTYGVAAAESFALTPFDVIHSYLNISDDLVNGLSLFASEVKRAQGIVETVKALQPGEKYFCALDELFTGTVAEDGEKCAYQFIKRVAQYDAVMFIYATHFGKLTELEAQNVGCINYKVDAPEKDAQGKLVYPYTLSQGINTTHVALDLAGEADLFG